MSENRDSFLEQEDMIWGNDLGNESSSYDSHSVSDIKFSRAKSILERFTDSEGNINYDEMWSRYDLDELCRLGVVPLTTEKGKAYSKKR